MKAGTGGHLEIERALWYTCVVEVHGEIIFPSVIMCSFAGAVGCRVPPKVGWTSWPWCVRWQPHAPIGPDRGVIEPMRRNR